MLAGEEIRFADGNITPVARIGGTVRRAAGHWTPAVHALLRHLEAAGFDGAPCVLGFDERGREVLTYIEGRTGQPSLWDCGSDGTLVEVARFIRRYHDAVATFRAPADADWQFQVGAPRAGGIICHNDLAPWNTVFAGNRPVALIDWDFAAPAPRLWDLAHALWRFTPLYADDGADEGFGPPEERARRMALFCDAYGLADRRHLLDTIERRQQVLYDTVAVWGRAGVPGFAELWRDGHGDGILNDLAYLQHHREELEALINNS